MERLILAVIIANLVCLCIEHATTCTKVTERWSVLGLTAVHDRMVGCRLAK